MSINIHALINCLILFTIVKPLPFIQNFFGLTSEDFSKYPDKDLDRDTSIKTYEFTPEIEIQRGSSFNNFAFSDLTSTDPNYNHFLQLISIIQSPMPQIMHTRSFYEPSFQDHYLDKSDLIIFGTQSSRLVDEILVKVSHDYELKIGFRQYPIINRFHYLNIQNSKFAIIGILPSFWNYSKNIWLILAPFELLESLCSYISEYREYLISEFDNKGAIFLLVPFKKLNANKFALVPEEIKFIEKDKQD